MFTKAIKNTVVILWIVIVVYFYFINHNYYLNGWNELGSWLFYILLIPLIYICYALYKWFNTEKDELKFRITFPRILATILLLILITGNTAFIIRGPSFHHGDSIFYTYDESTGEIAIGEVSDLSTLTGNEQLIVASESAHEQTKVLFEWLPENFHANFEFPKFFDIQIGLLSKSIAILLILGLLTLTAISSGFTILKKALGKTAQLTKDHALISLGLGLFTIALLSFFLGALSILNFYTAWGMFIALLLISWKTVWDILKKVFTFNYEFETKILNFNLVIILVIALALVTGFIDNLTPIPRGWDGLNQYLNIAKRLSEFNELITMGGNYYWELIMSLGFIMFNWTTAAMNIASFFPATLCLIALYLILRKFTSQKAALISTAAIYLTPIITFHGAEDNKVDIANFAMSIIAFLSIYRGVTAETKREKLSYIAIGGILCGFCLGIKLTSLMLIFSTITLLLHRAFRWKGALAGILFSLSLLAITQSIGFGSEISFSTTTYKITALTLFSLSAILVITSWLKNKCTRGLKRLVVLGLFISLAFSPWVVKNYLETNSLSSTALLFGDPPQPTIDYELLEDEYGLDRSLCASTGTFEELDRYLGYSPFLIKYVTLPWHTTMDDQGTQGIYVDIGWMFLAFLPVLILFIPFRRIDKKWSVMIWFGVSYWIFWLVTSNGIIWYGFPGFLALTAWTGRLIDNYEKQNKEFGKYLINIVVIIFLLTSLTFKLSTTGKGTLLLYVSNTMTAEQAQLAIFPSSETVYELFESDQDGQYDLIWKVGTPLNYFIPDNFWRTYNDQYLDDFNCLYAERDPELLTERLKALGFGYIIFDYYTYSLSPDPESTLAEKYNYSLDYLLNYTEMIVPDYYRGHLVAKIAGT